MARERQRMIFELPPEIQMALRLRAVKYNCTTSFLVWLSSKHSQ